MSNHGKHYHALNSDLHEIRLLTLSPGGNDSPLQCQLSTITLTAKAEYNALSYVWGDPVASASAKPEILLDGCHFPVTPNLYSALWHLRPPIEDRATHLWVDAICINQNDVAERGQQVAMMRDIYSSATQVTIWLGEKDEDSDMAFEHLSTIIGDVPWPQDKSTCSDIRRHCGNFYFDLTNRRSWFSRVWILQELAMSRHDPIVVCGYKRIQWSTFIAAWQTIAKEALADLGTRQKDNDIEVLNLTKLDVLEELRQSVQKRGGDTLRKLLIIARTSAATDPRDRVYGVLGMLEEQALDPQSSITIAVDYQKPCSEVYTDAMAHIFSRGEGPYFLSGIYLSGGPSTAPHIPALPTSIAQPDLPSWVPNFSRQDSELTTQPEGYHFQPPTTMHASGAGQGAQNGSVLSDRRTLQVEGLIVDTIIEVAPFGPSLEDVVRNLTQFEIMVTESRQRPCMFAPSITPLMQAFREGERLWRILISNKHLKSGYDPAPASYEAMYSSLVKDHNLQPPHCHAIDSSPPNEYEQILRSCVGKKSFFTTTNGFIGTCVPASRAGDVVVIVFGSPSPFVLRPIPVETDQQQLYCLIGCSYVGGIMNGEMVDELYCEDLMDSTTFLLR